MCVVDDRHNRPAILKRLSVMAQASAAEDALAKRLCFEDVSMQSPALFHRFQAQRAREAPSADGLRRCGALAPLRARTRMPALMR